MRMTAMVLVGMALIGGCDRDSDAGDARKSEGGLGSSGVSQAKKLSDLTQGEHKTVCDWEDKLVRGHKVPSTETLCAAVALEVSADEASCEMAAADCVEAGPNEDGEFCAESPDGDDSWCLGPDDLEPDPERRCAFDECGATVAVYEECIQRFADIKAAALASTSCADAGKDDAGKDDAGGDAFVAFFLACERLAKQCPAEPEEVEQELGSRVGPAFEADRRAQLAHWLDTTGLLQQVGPAFAELK